MEEFKNALAQNEMEQRKLLLIVPLLILSLLIFYSLIIEPNFAIRVRTIPVKILHNLGEKIVFISDLHFGSFSLKSKWDTVLSIIKEEKPEIIIIGGDIVSDRENESFAAATKFIQKLSDIAQVIIVPGNWDYATRFINKTNMQRLQNVTNNKTILLVNRWYLWKEENKTICIYGMDWLNPTYKKAPKECNLTIVVTHTPQYVTLINESVNIVLAGHTHGGQINLFGKPLYVPDHLKYYYGYYFFNNFTFYVTSGLGVHKLFPFRFGMPPEVVILS